MKTSNKILAGLVTTVLAATVLVDVLLKDAYAKIDLNNAFKNYQTIAIKPFKVLKTEGGNGYSIKITQSPVADLKVMGSRKNFLTVVQKEDTLLLKFTVPNNSATRDAENLPQGILLTSKEIEFILANGTNIFLNGWKNDSLNITLSGSAAIKFNKADISKLTLQGNQSAWVDFNEGNKIKYLNLMFSGNSIVGLKGIDYSVLKSQFTGNSQLVFNAQAASNLSQK